MSELHQFVTIDLFGGFAILFQLPDPHQSSSYTSSCELHSWMASWFPSQMSTGWHIPVQSPGMICSSLPPKSWIAFATYSIWWSSYESRIRMGIMPAGVSDTWGFSIQYFLDPNQHHHLTNTSLFPYTVIISVMECRKFFFSTLPLEVHLKKTKDRQKFPAAVTVFFIVVLHVSLMDLCKITDEVPSGYKVRFPWRLWGKGAWSIFMIKRLSLFRALIFGWIYAMK